MSRRIPHFLPFRIRQAFDMLSTLFADLLSKWLRHHDVQLGLYLLTQGSNTSIHGKTKEQLQNEFDEWKKGWIKNPGWASKWNWKAKDFANELTRNPPTDNAIKLLRLLQIVHRFRSTLYLEGEPNLILPYQEELEQHFIRWFQHSQLPCGMDDFLARDFFDRYEMQAAYVAENDVVRVVAIQAMLALPNLLWWPRRASYIQGVDDASGMSSSPSAMEVNTFPDSSQATFSLASGQPSRQWSSRTDSSGWMMIGPSDLGKLDNRDGSKTPTPSFQTTNGPTSGVSLTSNDIPTVLPLSRSSESTGYMLRPAPHTRHTRNGGRQFQSRNTIKR